ncbi:MAG: GNAT family N-acetyltransferase [Actinomycetota bacterium]
MPLETERLLLRPATLDDLDAWHAISRDAEEAWWGQPSSTLDDAQANLEKHISHHATLGFGLWAVELRDTHEVIGAAGLTHLPDSSEIEVGYRFLREHWGLGYATEAARAAIAFGFEDLGLDRIVAVTLPTNQGSRRVMEKAGLSYVGDTTHQEQPHVKYAIAR